MPRTNTTLAAAAGIILAAALATAGCTATTPPGPSDPTGARGPSADAAAIAWTDQACGAVLPIGSVGEKIAQISGGDEAGLTAVVTVLADAVQQSRTNLDGVGPSPIAGGDELVGALKRSFDEAGANITDARSAVSSKDPAAIGKAFQAITAPVEAVARLTDPQDNPELAAATQQAANCRKLLGSGSVPPTS